MKNLPATIILSALLATMAGCGEADEETAAATSTKSIAITETVAPETVAAVATSVKISAAMGMANANHWNQTVTITPLGAYVMGNPDAPVKLVEYGSRTCPACGQLGRDGLKPLEEKYVASGKVSFEYRDFLIHGAPDLAAAMIGRCGPKDKYFPMLAAMYADQAATLDRIQAMPAAEAKALEGKGAAAIATAFAKRAGYMTLGRRFGLSDAAMSACLSDSKQIDQLTRIYNDADAKVVLGTPTLLINGRKTDAISWQQLETALKKAGA